MSHDANEIPSPPYENNGFEKVEIEERLQFLGKQLCPIGSKNL